MTIHKFVITVSNESEASCEEPLHSTVRTSFFSGCKDLMLPSVRAFLAYRIRPGRLFVFVEIPDRGVSPLDAREHEIWDVRYEDDGTYEVKKKCLLSSHRHVEYARCVFSEDGFKMVVLLQLGGDPCQDHKLMLFDTTRLDKLQQISFWLNWVFATARETLLFRTTPNGDYALLTFRISNPSPTKPDRVIFKIYNLGSATLESTVEYKIESSRIPKFAEKTLDNHLSLFSETQ